MLTNAEIMSMRAAAASALPEQVSIIRPLHRSDGLGGMVSEESTVGIYKARLGTASQADTVTYADKLGAQVGYKLTFPGQADVQPRDRIRLGSRRFEVVAAPDRGAWEITRTVIAMEVVQ